MEFVNVLGNDTGVWYSRPYSEGGFSRISEARVLIIAQLMAIVTPWALSTAIQHAAFYVNVPGLWVTLKHSELERLRVTLSNHSKPVFKVVLLVASVLVLASRLPVLLIRLAVPSETGAFGVGKLHEICFRYGTSDYYQYGYLPPKHQLLDGREFMPNLFSRTGEPDEIFSAITADPDATNITVDLRNMSGTLPAPYDAFSLRRGGLIDTAQKTSGHMTPLDTVGQDRLIFAGDIIDEVRMMNETGTMSIFRLGDLQQQMTDITKWSSITPMLTSFTSVERISGTGFLAWHLSVMINPVSCNDHDAAQWETYLCSESNGPSYSINRTEMVGNNIILTYTYQPDGRSELGKKKFYLEVSLKLILLHYVKQQIDTGNAKVGIVSGPYIGRDAYMMHNPKAEHVFIRTIRYEDAKKDVCVKGRTYMLGVVYKAVPIYVYATLNMAVTVLAVILGLIVQPAASASVIELFMAGRGLLPGGCARRDWRKNPVEKFFKPEAVLVMEMHMMKFDNSTHVELNSQDLLLLERNPTCKVKREARNTELRPVEGVRDMIQVLETADRVGGDKTTDFTTEAGVQGSRIDGTIATPAAKLKDRIAAAVRKGKTMKSK